MIAGRLLLVVLSCGWLGSTASAEAASRKLAVRFPVAAVAARPLTITGTVGSGLHGSHLKVTLERRAAKRWVAVATGPVRARRSFSLTFTTPRASAVTLRVRVRSGRRVMATSATKHLKLGSAPRVPASGGAPVSATSVAASAEPSRPGLAGNDIASPPPLAPPPSPPTPPVVVPPASTVASAPAPGEDGTLLITGTTNLQPGDFVAVGVGPATPDGFLGQVVAVQEDNSQTVVTTKPAALTDVLPTGDIDAHFETPEETSPSLAPGGPGLTAPRGSGLDALGADLSCTSTGSLTLPKPKVSLSKSIDFKAHWSLLHGLETASLTGTVTAKATVTAEASGAVHCTLPSTTVATFKGAPVTFSVGPIPVVLTPNASVTLDASAQASADVKTGLSISATATAGAQYERGRGTSPVSSFKPGFSATAPTVSASARVDASLTPSVDVLVYGLAGPRLTFAAGLAFDANVDDNPWWTLTAPVDLTAQLVVPALKLSTPKLHVYRHTFDLAHADGPYNGTGTNIPALQNVAPVDGGTNFFYTPPATIEGLTPRGISCEYRDSDDTPSPSPCGNTDDTTSPSKLGGLYRTPGRQYRIAYYYDGGVTSAWSNWVTFNADNEIGSPVLNSVAPVDGGTNFFYTPPATIEGLTPRGISCEYRDSDDTPSPSPCGNTDDTTSPSKLGGLYLTPGRQYRIAYYYDGGVTSAWSNWRVWRTT